MDNLRPGQKINGRKIARGRGVALKRKSLANNNKIM
jgi:hypothetical protein